MLLHTIIVLAGFAAYAHGSCLHGTSKLRRRFTAEGKVQVSKFGYTSLQGPVNWANLAADNEACRTGKNQSPINLQPGVTAQAAEAPIIDIPNVEFADFENLGTTIEVVVNGTTTVAGRQFNLVQFHLHTPSEHRINEEYFPLEMHMVHQAADNSGDIAVLGALFQLSTDGSTTALLASLTHHMDKVAEPGSITETGPLDFAPLVSHLTTTPLLQYSGSLTTPPCAEGITFLIAEQPMPLDVATYNSIKRVVKFNARYEQGEPGLDNLLALAARGMAGGEGAGSPAAY
ncbi:hypothetical protein W97_01846 [Coniosporium apollinis CBS 100218]|uniref:Carbonic anhydrase n=1 Tax=Coniosporium apollinis (strain CBS 100218) TaxID=1168221 RepID=R7YL36_CONA1|nr:uncharacterized protein W97_01846 [Coniosporium apollinis CBS 100218]EON62622.1 hypothetical protein W97_01846 [Coniosporium apollinis CBS 100218]